MPSASNGQSERTWPRPAESSRNRERVDPFARDDELEEPSRHSQTTALGVCDGTLRPQHHREGRCAVRTGPLTKLKPVQTDYIRLPLAQA
jgi:hypothetical protein